MTTASPFMEGSALAIVATEFEKIINKRQGKSSDIESEVQAKPEDNSLRFEYVCRLLKERSPFLAQKHIAILRKADDKNTNYMLAEAECYDILGEPIKAFQIRSATVFPEEELPKEVQEQYEAMYNEVCDGATLNLKAAVEIGDGAYNLYSVFEKLENNIDSEPYEQFSFDGFCGTTYVECIIGLMKDFTKATYRLKTKLTINDLVPFCTWVWSNKKKFIKEKWEDITYWGASPEDVQLAKNLEDEIDKYANEHEEDEERNDDVPDPKALSHSP